MILAGQSAGGIVSMYTAGTQDPQGLVAVLGFAAGRSGEPRLPAGRAVRHRAGREAPGVGRPQRQGAGALHYAENDLYFNAQTSRLWYERFAAGGGRAEYVLQPAFGRDGHYIFSEVLGVRYWLPAVEQFLVRHGIPFERLDAAQPIVAVERVPHVRSDACRGLYRAFLESPTPRAYAVSADGRYGFAGGLPNAVDAAVRECRTKATEPCTLYAVDAEVVWAPDGRAPRTLAARSERESGPFFDKRVVVPFSTFPKPRPAEERGSDISAGRSRSRCGRKLRSSSAWRSIAPPAERSALPLAA